MEEKDRYSLKEQSVGLLDLLTDLLEYILFCKIIKSKCKSTQKQPGCKKGVALLKMASVKKVVKSKGWPRIGCDDIG